MECRRHVCDHSHPANSGTPTDLRQAVSQHHAPEQIRIIDPGTATQRRPRPDSRIEIEEFVSAVATIVLELQFGETRVMDGGQQAVRRFLDFGYLDGLDEAAPVAEVYRVLARPPAVREATGLPSEH